jgi:DNA-directed RNA polymerase specialized sigma24 family protein
MERQQIPHLLDEQGQPLDSRLDNVLRHLVPKFRRRFPKIWDDFDLTEILEETARRVASWERRFGQVSKLHGFAWVTLQNVAKSRMELDQNRLKRDTLGAEASEALLSRAEAVTGSKEQIERKVQLKEMLRSLSLEQRLVCNRKMFGYSGADIARQRGTSEAAVDMLFSRAKRKLRNSFNASKRPTLRQGSKVVRRSDSRRTPIEVAPLETDDGEKAPET